MTEIEMWVTERDGTKIAPLPEANLSKQIKWDLNGVHTAGIKLDPLSEGARQIEGIIREIQIWMNGWLAFQGVPWGIGGNSREISVEMEGPMSLFNVRFVDRTSLLYTSIDQISIAWNLLAYAQNESVDAYRDFNIDAATPLEASGILRSRDYKREEHKNILDALKEFDSRKLSNGFDWDLELMPDGQRFWTPYFPRKGQARPEWKIEWDDSGNRNIANFNWGEDFLEVGTLAYVTGGSVSSGGVTIRKEGKYEDLGASAYWGQIQKIISEGSQLDEGWLDDRAQQVVESSRFPKITTGVTQALGVDSEALHTLRTGDWVPVFIDHGRIQVNQWQRIESIAYNPNDSLTLTFGEEVLTP